MMENRADFVSVTGPAISRSGRGPLRTHALFIAVFTLSSALTALALTYIYAERYAAETILFFKPANVTKLSEVQVQALGSPVPNTPFKVISQTLSGLAKSDALLRQVVLDLSLQIPPVKTVSSIWYVEFYREAKDWLSDYGEDAWDLLKYGEIITPDPVEFAVSKVRSGLKVISEDSYVFNLSVRYKSPEAAAAIANDIAARLTDMLHQVDQEAAERQRAEIKRLAELKFADMVALDDRIRDLLAANHLASVQLDIEKSTGRYSELALASADADAELAQQQARLGGLSGKLRQHETRLLDDPATDEAAPRGSGGHLSSGNLTTLSTERLMADINVGGLKARSSRVVQSLAQLDRHLEDLTQVQARYDPLWQQLATAKRDYVALQDALAETILKGGDTQNELRVASVALPGTAPVSPIKIYHVGLAAAVAALLACGLAYVLAYFDIQLFLPRPTTRPRAPRVSIELGNVAVGHS